MANTLLNPLSKEIKEGISVFTCCMNRNENLDRALATWVKVPEIDEIIILDWSSSDPVKPIADKYNDSRIIVARAEGQERWILSYAFNLAARLTTRKKVLKMDADVELEPDFFQFHQLKPGQFFTGNWQLAKTENDLHLNGVVYVYREDFFRVNGYNEYIKTYGWDDSDLYTRLESAGLSRSDLILSKLNHMEHEERMAHQNSVFDMRIIDEAAYLQFETNKNQYIAHNLPDWNTESKLVNFDIEAFDHHTLICKQKSQKSMYIISDQLIEEAEVYALGALVSGDSGPCKTKIPWEISNSLSKDFLIKLYSSFNLIEKKSNSKLENIEIYNYLVDVAWNFYSNGYLLKMTQYLHKSLSYTTYSLSKTFDNWTEQFFDLSSKNNRSMNFYQLCQSAEWKQLISQALQEEMLNYVSTHESSEYKKLYQSKNTGHIKILQKHNFKPRVTIVTSCFKGDQYIDQFLKDITQQTIFSQCELMLINPNSPQNEDSVIVKYLLRYPNIIYIKLDYDPGLYEVWNMGVRLGQGEYATNANLDDRRFPAHLEQHVKALDENPDVDMVSAPLYVTYEKNETWDNNTAHDLWFVNFPDYYTAKDLFLEEEVNGVKTGKIVSQNLAHCMPVWRKSIHEKNGYFDEETYGTSCDWEFWLRCGVNGSKYMLLKEPLGLYLEDPNSHNRRFSNKQALEDKIVENYCIPMLKHQKVDPHFYKFLA